MRTFKIADHPCDQCLFSNTAIVTAERRQQIVAELRERDTHFICHKFTLAGDEACCAGDYARNPCRTNLMRIAGRLGQIEFVPLPGESAQTWQLPEAPDET